LLQSMALDGALRHVGNQFLQAAHGLDQRDVV
jgi:hypothetical protein